MFAAKQNQTKDLQMPRALSRGDSRLQLFSFERETSTAQGRGIQSCWSKSSVVATCVKLHGTSPWHPVLLVKIIGSSNLREVKRGKPVASFFE